MSGRSARGILALVVLIVVSRPVRAAAPDVVLIKSNDVGGSTSISSPTWTWIWTVRNQGDQATTLGSFKTLFSDFLPITNITYDSPVVASYANVSGSVFCEINASTRLMCTAMSDVTFQPGGELTVTVQATASASGAYVNPRSGFSCFVSGFDFNPEDNDGTNNECANTVTVTSTQADLSATKTNNVSGQSVSGGSWVWSIQILNSAGAGAPAGFSTGQTVLIDNLPNTDVTYGTPTVLNGGGATGTLNCTIAAFDLTCTAASAISIPASGTMTVSIPATSATEALYANPRSGGTCAVDPNDVVVESSSANNGCSNSVSTITADMIVTKTNDVSGSASLGNPSWTWSLAIENIGTLAKTFNNGTQILFDALPNADIVYGTPSVSLNGGVTGALDCSVTSFNLRCYAIGSTTFNHLGKATVTLTATASASALYANPRPGGSCYVSGTDGIPNDQNSMNDSCSDSVVVTASVPDLSVVKSNDVAGQSRAGSSWTWSWLLQNSPGAGVAAQFSNGQRLLFDNLPDAAIAYGTPAATLGGGATGTVVCAVASSNLTCTASGAVLIPASGTVTVTLAATASEERVYLNPRAGGVCTADPDGLITESSEANNSCSNQVTTETADVSISKTNNVGGSVSVESPSWTWTLVARNNGVLAKTWSSGQQIIRDALPATAITYGVPSVVLDGVTGQIDCSIDGNPNLICTSNGSVVLSGGGTITVSVPATATGFGTYANPRSGGSCFVDGFNATPEDRDGSDNTCADTVTVVPPADLTVTKSNDTSGQSQPGGSWTWTLLVANDGSNASTFPSGAVILTDDLPNTAITYGTPSVALLGGTSGTVQCAIVDFTLTCSATGGPVILPGGGSISVGIPATGSDERDHANPRTAGTCAVDPGLAVTEFDETNNSCSDTVSTRTADLVVAKTNDVGGSTVITNPTWTWTFVIENAGTRTKSFSGSTQILLDELPTGPNYFAPQVTLSGVTGGSLSCSIDAASDLTCTASGSLQFPAGAKATVTVLTEAGTPGVYANPRSGGECRAFGSNGTPADVNTANDTCSDTVTVLDLPDLTATKTNDIGGSTTLGQPAWNWVITLANGGQSPKSFPASTTILSDALPNTSISYGTPSVVSGSGVNGTIACAIDSFTLTCTTIGTVTIDAGASATVTIPATAAAVGTYANPRTAGGCSVNSGVGTPADSSTANDTCADTVTVTAAATSTALTSSAPSSPVGQSVTFTATVTSSASATIGGSVAFRDGASTLGSGTISGGVATFTTATLSQGTHSITAVYQGNATFLGSTSDVLTQTVTPSPFGPPAVVNATASSTTRVVVRWTEVSGASSYEVWRKASAAGYALLVSTSSTAVSDIDVTPDHAYAYQVRAVGASGPSAFSVANVATTVLFSDTTLGSTVTVKATHIEELRRAVNAMRILAGLGEATFTNSSLTAGATFVKRAHITELRTALDAARTSLDLPAISYATSITAGVTQIQAAHITELRAGTQ